MPTPLKNIFHNQPLILVQVATHLIALGAAFGLSLTQPQELAIIGVVEMAGMAITWTQVKPVAPAKS